MSANPTQNITDKLNTLTQRVATLSVTSNDNNGKLNIRPSVTKTDDNIQTDSNLQYLLDEDTVNIFTSQGPIKLPKESLTVNINTDKLYDEKSGTVSYVKRKDDGSKKANIYLNTVAKNNEPEKVYH